MVTVLNNFHHSNQPSKAVNTLCGCRVIRSVLYCPCSKWPLRTTEPKNNRCASSAPALSPLDSCAQALDQRHLLGQRHSHRIHCHSIARPPSRVSKTSNPNSFPFLHALYRQSRNPKKTDPTPSAERVKRPKRMHRRHRRSLTHSPDWNGKPP